MKEAPPSPQSFDLSSAIAVLERTPATLTTWLDGLPPAWLAATEGPGTWSPYDVVGHLIHGERTDWMPRARHILARASGPFERFDRGAQFRDSAGKTLAELLATFAALRRANLEELRGWDLGPDQLALPGLHPELGAVTLSQLLACWVVHDLDHVTQIARTMAKAYGEAVGPWTAYLSVLTDRRR